LHSQVLSTAKYRYGEKFLYRKIKFYFRTGNPPSAFKQISSNSSGTGKNRWAGPKTFVYIRVANLQDISPKKANWMMRPWDGASLE
jgi:hypothetical protein